MYKHSHPTDRARQFGLTLIELMVSLVIGLLLAIVASSAYVYSKQAYNSVSENSQLEENGRFALTVLARNIQSAGFVAMQPNSTFAQSPSDLKVNGCDFGMVNPRAATSTADLACLASTPAGTTQSGSIGVFFDTDAYTAAGARYQGFDCLGNAAVIVPPTAGATTNTFQVRSYFFISNSTVQTSNGTATMGQLSCVTDPTTVAGATGTFLVQPLIPGIHQLRATYLTPSGLSTASAQRQNTAAQASANWSRVVAVELCVLTRSIQPSGNDSQTQVADCYGNMFTPPQSQTFRRFTTVVNMRNRSPI
jgi:type IV pilus assembly protein PilW